MKRIGLFIVSLSLLTGNTLAKEPNAIDPNVTARLWSWSGPYMGVHGGYGFSDNAWTLLQNAGGAPSAQIGTVVTSHDADGALGGVQAGYDYQISSRFVVGAEATFSLTDMDGYSTWRNQANLFRDGSTDINWIATIAGRGGIAFDRTLFYLKGGVAVAGEDFSHTGGQPATPRHLTGSDTHVGLVVGAGIEHAWTDSWSTKLEYNYMDFGEEEASLTDGTRTARFGIDQDVHVVKLAVSFRISR